MLRSIGLPELIFVILLVVVIFKGSRFVGGSIVGVFLGAFVGFLLRPSLPVVGQLPLGAVITRGSNLSGLDLVFRSTAEQSFNYMLIGAIIGAVVLGAVGRSWDHHDEKALAPPTTTSPVPPIASLESPINKFCTKCGNALAPEIIFCGACGTRRS